jgi:hypothetical protein
MLASVLQNYIVFLAMIARVLIGESGEAKNTAKKV